MISDGLNESDGLVIISRESTLPMMRLLQERLLPPRKSPRERVRN